MHVIVQMWNVAMRLQKIRLRYIFLSQVLQWQRQTMSLSILSLTVHPSSWMFPEMYWGHRWASEIWKNISIMCGDHIDVIDVESWLKDQLTSRLPSSALHSRWVPRKRQSPAATCNSLLCCLLHLKLDCTIYQRGDSGASWRPDAAPGL